MTTKTKIIIAVVALLVLGGAAYWYFTKNKPEDDKEADKPQDKPAPKVAAPKSAESQNYAVAKMPLHDVPVSSPKVVPIKETVSANPPPRTMAPSAGISVTKDGTTVAPLRVVKLTSTNSDRKGGKIV